jgi:hypothetical protein
MAQRSLHAVIKVYYRSYVKLCQGSTHYHIIAKVFCGSHGTMTPLTPCEPRRVTTPNSYLFEQGTLHITPLIIKPAVPYRTRGDTCCPGVRPLPLNPNRVYFLFLKYFINSNHFDLNLNLNYERLLPIKQKYTGALHHTIKYAMT